MMRNILFICTGNSARSIMAEAYLNAAGKGRWRAFSAGSRPAGRPHPAAIETLRAEGVDPGQPRSKSWEEFAGDAAPKMDAVVTVCDGAAGEICPIWPTRPGSSVERLHWSFPDPAAEGAGGDEKRAAFAAVFAGIRAKIDLFLAERP